MKAVALLICLGLAGCATFTPTHNNVPRLLAHPEAKAAANAAPKFFIEVMDTIAEQDHELNRK
jgi:hypothetical protein